MGSDVSMLPPLSSVRQDSDWEFDEAIREALGLGIIPEVQLQGIVLKSCHPSLLDHDYIKLELDSENSIATQPSEATTTTYPEEESSELESEATDNDELPKNDRAEECPNKKNPFHVCTAYCEERWTPQLQDSQDETLLVDLDSDTSTATQPSEATTTNILKDNVEKKMAMQTKPKAFKFRKVSTTDGPRPAKSMKTCNKTYPSCTATSTSGQFSEMSIENLRAIGIMKKFPLPKRSKKSNTAPLSSLAATNSKLCQFDAETKTESSSKSLPSQMETSVKKDSKDRVIYFSLETTGMNRNRQQDGVQICCMAAYYNGDMFEAYLTPTKNFQPGATAYNGMKLSRGVLTKNGKKVECAESMGNGLKRFIEWLSNACDDQTGQLILVAHNSTNFHARPNEKFKNRWTEAPVKSCLC